MAQSQQFKDKKAVCIENPVALNGIIVAFTLLDTPGLELKRITWVMFRV
jgi:hypothetical protein